MGNSNTEDQLMQTSSEHFHQGGKIIFSDRNPPSIIDKKRKSIDQNSLSISDQQIDYFNLKHSMRNNERANFAQSRCSYCVGSNPTKTFFRKQRKGKGYKNHPLIHRTPLIR